MKYVTPAGHEIKEYDIFVGKFVPKEHGCVMTREDWLACNFARDDGHLGEIIVNGLLTVYELKGWASEFYLTFGEKPEKVYFSLTNTKECYRVHLITMEAFKALPSRVEVCWYNK